MAEYNGSIELISGITQKGGGTFPLAAAKDIQVDESGKRLDAKLSEQDDEIERIKQSMEDEGGKTELPEVSAADNGKVLSVVGGAWAAAEMESGDVPFFDLAALGLPNVPRNSAAALAMDMTDIVAAHEKGLARMAINVEGVGRYEFVATALTQGLKFFYALYGTGRIQVVLTDAGVMVGVFETLPIVTDDDNGKVLTVTDGRWAAAEAAGGGMTIPVHDLSAMGLPAIEVGNMNGVFVETDTTQLMQDLANGVVTLKMNVSLRGNIIGAVKTCGGIVLNEAGMATITNIDSLGEMMVYSTIIMQDGFIGAMAYQLDSMITSMIDAYMEDALGGDY